MTAHVHIQYYCVAAMQCDGDFCHRICHGKWLKPLTEWLAELVELFLVVQYLVTSRLTTSELHVCLA